MSLMAYHAWSNANSLLSHKDREVRGLALYSLELMRKVYTKEILDKLENPNYDWKTENYSGWHS